MKRNELKELIRGYIICTSLALGLFILAAGATEAANRTKMRGQGINQPIVSIDSLKSQVGEYMAAAANRKGEKKPPVTEKFRYEETEFVTVPVTFETTETTETEPNTDETETTAEESS